MSKEIRRIADQFLDEPEQIQVNQKEGVSNAVKQFFFTVREEEKPSVVEKLIDQAPDFYGLIFCQTKALVTDLTERLKNNGYAVDCLHGDMEQNARERTMKAFKAKTSRVLICTDVASRGIDVKELTHVVNYSLPRELDLYVHRIGRTGRAGASGLAISFVSATDSKNLADIEKMIKTKVELETIEFNDGFSSRPRESTGDSRGYRDGAEGRPRGGSSRENFERAHSTSAAPAWGQRSYERKTAPVDPFFDKPYEASPAKEEQLPSWESTAKTTSRSISANIKPKRKVAALFKTEIVSPS
jgi:superfamily II DNA/RNA helicase